MAAIRPTYLALLALTAALDGGAGEPPADRPEHEAGGRRMGLELHHDGRPPDYVAALGALELAAVPLPPAPQIAPPLDRLHHGDEAPRYAVDFRPPEPAPIALPAPPPGAAPATVRGIYLNAWVFGSSRLYDLVRLADTTEINAFVIDVKDASGYLTYRSNVPIAVTIGANTRARAPDARSRIAALNARGIHPIARIVVARDPLLARRKPEWAVLDARGGLWHDGLDEPWVDAYHDSVWVYAADLAAEAVVLGFREIQFDYVRFPDEPSSRLRHAVFAARRDGESQRAAIRRHVAMLGERVGVLGVPFTLDVFGLTTSARGDMGIGQSWEDLAALADVLLPMVYPSHYPRGAYGIAYPNAEPYAVVRRALEDALHRSRAVPDPARIRPYLQAFTLRQPRYTATHVRAQIQAVEDLGITDWILWNARGAYPPEALRHAPARAGSPAVASPDANDGTP